MSDEGQHVDGEPGAEGTREQQAGSDNASEAGNDPQAGDKPVFSDLKVG